MNMDYEKNFFKQKIIVKNEISRRFFLEKNNKHPW